MDYLIAAALVITTSCVIPVSVQLITRGKWGLGAYLLIGVLSNLTALAFLAARA